MELYLALAGAFLFVYLSLRNIERRQSAIELRLLLLSRHLGLLAEADSKPSEKVRGLARDGDKYVEALRTYREETGSDLKQATLAVNSLISSTREA